MPHGLLLPLKPWRETIKIFLFRTPLRSRMLSKLLALVPFRSLHEYPAIDYNVAADPESGMMMEDGM